MITKENCDTAPLKKKVNTQLSSPCTHVCFPSQTIANTILVADHQTTYRFFLSEILCSRKRQTGADGLCARPKQTASNLVPVNRSVAAAATTRSAYSTPHNLPALCPLFSIPELLLMLLCVREGGCNYCQSWEYVRRV